MAIEIHIPRLGWNMDEGVFAGWHKRDGEAVRAGEPLFILEGEKATQDVEASEDGILRVAPAAPRVGDRVPVGAVIGHLLRPGEPEPEVPPTTDSGRRGAPASSPALATTRPEARTARDRPKASPLARRVARELNIDWTTLRGSGRSGRIRKADVLAAARARPEDTLSRPDASPSSPSRSIPIGPIRRAVAARMVESRQATAPVTLTTTVDATNLVNLRGQFRAAGSGGGDPPSYTDFVVKLTALALRDHPLLHSRWQDDRIVVPAEADIGIAVDTEAGLLVPVIRGAAGLGIRELAARSRDLVRRARDGSLRADEMRGGTFTVTNLGAFGVEAFTPIINPPECAILGMGRIARQAVMEGDRVVARERMSLSLTFDHRVADGAPAARFLQALGRLIENPCPWLMP